MKQNLTMTARQNNVERIVMNLMATAQQPVSRLASYYGSVLDRPINIRQTLHLVNAQVAFLFTAFAACGLLLRVACIAWLLSALMGCKTALGEQA